MKRFHTVLFDLDGTLTDSSEGITKCVQYALRYFGIDEQDQAVLERFIGPPLDAMFMEIYGFSAEEARKARDVYRERYEPVGIYENRPYEGIPEMLALLQERGIVLAVATSKPEIYSRKILERFGLAPYLAEVSGADMDEKHVSKADVIREALRRLRGDAAAGEGVLMVGDRKYDVEGAHECGIPCVGVGFGFAQEGELESSGAEYMAGTVEDLRKLLLELVG